MNDQEIEKLEFQFFEKKSAIQKEHKPLISRIGFDL